MVHCAASVEFSLPIAEATAANVTGALHAVEVARACRRLAGAAVVSTAYVTPHPGGGILGAPGKNAAMRILKEGGRRR